QAGSALWELRAAVAPALRAVPRQEERRLARSRRREEIAFAPQDCNGCAANLRTFLPSLSALCVCINPLVDSLIPKPAVLGLQDPVSFIGEVEHPRWHLQTLQGRE